MAHTVGTLSRERGNNGKSLVQRHSIRVESRNQIAYLIKFVLIIQTPRRGTRNNEVLQEKFMSLLTSSHDCTGDRRLVVMASYKINTFFFLTIMIFKSLPDAEQAITVSVRYGRDASQLEGYSNNLIYHLNMYLPSAKY